MVASNFFFVTNDTLIKLASERLPIGEILFIRGLMAGTLLTVLVFALGLAPRIRFAFNRNVGLRMIGEWASTFAYLTALFRIPIATAYVIAQVMPLAITAAAAVFLGERVGWRRWVAISIGLAGVVLVVRPGLDFDPFALLVLVSVAFMVLRDFAARAIPPEVPGLVVAWVMAFGVALMGFSVGLTETWHWPTTREFLELAGAAVLLSGGYYTVIEAMRLGDLSVTAPFRYTAIVFAVAWGYLVWTDIPDLLTVVGATIIIATGAYTFHRERVAGRAVARAAAGRR
jgi:drug/metabolite transporter (DMT)-like permease